MAEPIKMPVGMPSAIGARMHVLHGDPDLPMHKHNFEWGKGGPL